MSPLTTTVPYAEWVSLSGERHDASVEPAPSVSRELWEGFVPGLLTKTPGFDLREVWLPKVHANRNPGEPRSPLFVGPVVSNSVEPPHLSVLFAKATAARRPWPVRPRWSSANYPPDSRAARGNRKWVSRKGPCSAYPHALPLARKRWRERLAKDLALARDDSVAGVA